MEENKTSTDRRGGEARLAGVDGHLVECIHYVRAEEEDGLTWVCIAGEVQDAIGDVCQPGQDDALRLACNGIDAGAPTSQEM